MPSGPAKGFNPSTGELNRLQLPTLDASLRIGGGVREGDRIADFFDLIIAMLIAQGVDRNAAIERKLAALDEVNNEGVETNVASSCAQTPTGFAGR